MLRNLILRNGRYKLLAFLLAFVLVWVKHEDQLTVVTTTVRIRLTHPEHRVLVSPPVDKVRITVEGGVSRLRGFDVDGIPDLDMKLSGYEEDQVMFEPNAFKLPRDILVREMRPPGMVVKFEERGERVVRVEPKLEGEPAEHFRMTQVTVTPPEVTVVGPESTLKKLEKIPTEVIKLTGRNQTTTLSVQLASPPLHSSYLERGRRHDVTLAIEEKTGARVFAERAVSVRGVAEGAPGFEVSPSVVAITYEGPVRAVNALSPEQVQPYVDAAKLGAGKVHSLKVSLDAIEGVTASEVSPKKVTLVRKPDPSPPPDDGEGDTPKPN